MPAFGVAPKFPYMQDFSKVPDGAVPARLGEHARQIRRRHGEGREAPPQGQRQRQPLDRPRQRATSACRPRRTTPSNATFKATQVGEDLPDMGIVAESLHALARRQYPEAWLVSWDALPRVDTTISFAVTPGSWYRMKLTTDKAGNKGIVKGKVWPRDQKEPKEWTVELTDPRPIAEGSPAFYGYVTGILRAERAGNRNLLTTNVRITPNGK